MNKRTVFALIVGIGVISLAVFSLVSVGNTQGQQQNVNRVAAKVLRPSSGNTNTQTPQVQQERQPTEKELDDAATPIVDFNNPASSQSNKRSTKNARFKNQNFVTASVHPEIGEVERSTGDSSLVAATDLPVEQSDLIIEGKISDSQAFLSDDKTGVYSEFTIKVSKVLDANSGLNVKNGDDIIAERIGGRVRYPSGQIVRYNLSGQGSPMKSKKYVLFLKRSAEGDYELLTAYELQDNKTRALDGSKLKLRGGMATSIYSKHNGKDVAQLNQEIESKVKEKKDKKDKGGENK